jgi:DNA-directed RNA polymerase, mitochondrial
LRYDPAALRVDGTLPLRHLQAHSKQLLSTYEEQLQRQERAEAMAREAALSQHRRTREIGKESALSYGQKLYRATHDVLARAVAQQLEAFVADPKKARMHAAAMPFLDQFKGPGHIAAVGLVAAIDQFSRRQRLPTFFQNIGAAIEKENRLMKLERFSRLELRHLMRSGMSRSKISSVEVMRQLGRPEPRWDDRTRLQVGCFLGQAILESTELFTVKMQKVGRHRARVVVPSDQALHFVQTSRVPAWKASHAAMLTPPVPWMDGLFGGGLLGNMECLIKVPIQDAEDINRAIAHYEATDMKWLLFIVNWLQAVPLVVDDQLPALMRTAWEGGFDGLWPCSRAPMQVPDRLGSDPDPAELKARNRMAAMAYRDAEQNRPKRIKIERALRQAESLAGRDVWQAFHADHRGRLYTANRYCTHQGPDYEKSLLSFKDKKPVDHDAMEWILKAAAGHYGLSRKSWDERLAWGYDNRQLLLSAAEDPLERTELWRGAADPWQFLQLCKGYKEAVETGRSGVPIRLDQTTSGCGILAALVRDKTVARACNLWGSTRHDLYTEVAEAVLKRVQRDLEFGDTRERTLAEIWLGRGIDRGLVKGPVLSVPYGGSYQSITDKLVTELDEHLGFVPLEDFALKVAIPARYMASHLWAELKDAVAPVDSVKKWLKTCCRMVMKAGYPLHWHTPMGWPMLSADRESKKHKVETLLYGTKIGMTIADQPLEAPLSATNANKALPANLVHSFDAALVHIVVTRAAEQRIHMLTNHDCFAVPPANADQVHKLLLNGFAEIYKTDWLGMWREEIQAGTGLVLPLPPIVGDLDVGLIGTNVYLFS